MPTSNHLIWAAVLLTTFFVFFIVSMILRNDAAKKDSLGKSEKDSIENSVSIKPRKHTEKLRD